MILNQQHQSIWMVAHWRPGPWIPPAHKRVHDINIVLIWKPDKSKWITTDIYRLLQLLILRSTKKNRYCLWMQEVGATICQHSIQNNECNVYFKKQWSLVSTLRSLNAQQESHRKVPKWYYFHPRTQSSAKRERKLKVDAPPDLPYLLTRHLEGNILKAHKEVITKSSHLEKSTLFFTFLIHYQGLSLLSKIETSYY